MFAFVSRQENVLTKRGLVTRRIKASQMVQSIVYVHLDQSLVQLQQKK